MKNKLYYGDNLEVLRKYIKDETVDLCYIDPPFNSKRNYNQIYNNIGSEDRAQAQAFVDMWVWDEYANKGFSEILANDEGRFATQTVDLLKGLQPVLKKGSLLVYLVSMALRITEIHRVLKPTGSFYLHCDPTASHYLKLVIDAIFVSQGDDYKNEIVWPRTNAHNIASKYFAHVQDTIFYYTKTDKYTWNPSFTDFSPQQLKRYFRDPTTGRLITGQDLTMTGNAHRNFTWRGTTPPPHRGWGFSEEQLEALWEQGLILTKQDGTPRLDGRKVFLDEKLGKTHWLLIWDNASWHKSQAVRSWIRQHNLQVKQTGIGVRILPFLLPKQSRLYQPDRTQMGPRQAQCRRDQWRPDRKTVG